MTKICPKCKHEFEELETVEGVSGCCPRCYARVKGETLTPDQSGLGEFSE